MKLIKDTFRRTNVVKIIVYVVLHDNIAVRTRTCMTVQNELISGLLNSTSKQ